MNKLNVPGKYIGIPFLDNGSDFSGIDCVHLAKLFAENELGVKVHKMPADIKEAQKNNHRYQDLLEDIPLNKLEPGDVPFFAFSGNRWHCGVYIGYGKMLHTIRPLFDHKKSYSTVTPILPRWSPFYLGAIRTRGKKEIFIPDAGDPGTITLICLIISTIISIYSVVAAVTASKPSFGNDSGSSKYGFDILDNTMSNEVTYPIIFGRNKVAGNVIWYKSDGDNIQKIIVLGIGPINSVSDVRINDIPIADLPGCSYTAYLGTPNQAVDSRAGSEVKGLRNIAYLAVTFAPSEKLSGSTQTVTCIVEGLKMKTWDGASWSGETYSQNPAACYRKLLTMPREDGGAGASESEINDAAFGEVYDNCAALIDDGEGGTHARHQFDFIFDAQKPMRDAITEILQPYGMFSTVDEKINLGILKAESSVYAFTEDNIDADSFRYYQISKDESYNEVNVKYTDPDQNDVGIDVPARDLVDQIATGAIRPGDFSFLGISRFTEASRRAEFIKNESNVNTWMCEFDVDIDALHNTVGDVVTITHTLPGWTAKPVRIMEITEMGNFKRHIIAKEENSSIYNDAQSAVIETYDYGSPPNPYAPVADVAGLTVTESTYYRHKDGTVGSDILVSWTGSAGVTRQFLSRYRIELKKGSDDYKTVGHTSDANFTIFAVEDEVTYKVRVKTESVNDKVSDGVESSDLYVLGKQQKPSNVTGFEVYQEGNLLKFSWTAVSDIDISRYVIRQGSEWNTGTTIAEKVDVTEFVYPVGEVGTLNFMIKAIDRSENESNAPAIDQITVIPPPDMNFVNTFDRWSKPFEYLLSNLELVQVNYHDSGYNRPALAIRTATTWEEREAEAKTWEQQEADGGLLLDSTLEATGYAEMKAPLDLETIFEFKLVLDADYQNVTGGSVTVQISYSEDGVTYSSFADVDPDLTYRARYLKFKIIIATTDTAYNLYLYDLTIYINAPVTKVAWGKDLAIPIAGKTITFGAGFTMPPRLKANIVNGIVGVVIADNKTADSAELKVYDMAGSAIGTGEVDWEARGY